MRESMMAVRRAMALVAMVALVALAACGDGESGGNGALAALGVKDGASRGVSKSAQVTPEKGARIELSTGAQLEVPKGALDKSLTVTMERPADGKALDLVQRFKTDQDRIVSAPYVLKPHGTKFNEEVTVTLPLSKMGTREEVEVAWLEDEDDKEWKKLGVAKSDGKSAQITLKHFSVLVVVQDASDLRGVDAEPDAGGGTPDASNPGDDDAGSEPDAGKVEPDMDASTSVDSGVGLDAGIDASVPGLEDTGAQLDAGATLDGFVPIDPDPDSGTTQLPDATVLVDASAPVLTAQLVAERLYDRLLQCGLIAVEGPYSVHLGTSDPRLCEVECLTRGTCEEAHSHYCPSIMVNDGGGYSPAVASCMEACRDFTCPDGSSGRRCNESIDCANGEDEQNCGGTFKCGAETIDYGLRCNMYVDCLDGSDEQGCFFCDGDTKRLQPEQLCDDNMDCDDQTDVSPCAGIFMCPLQPG